jgi:hypothetical protein
MEPTLGSRSAAIVIIGLLALLLASCGGGGSSSVSSTAPRTYPAAVTKAFARSCVAAARASSAGKLTAKKATTYCQVALTCIESHFTVAQLKVYQSNVVSGKANPSAKVLTKCETAAIKKVQ